MTRQEFFENTSGVESVNIYDKSNYDKNIAIEKCENRKIVAMSYECDNEQSIYADLEIK